MADLDAAARQALQDVLALKEEVASAADDLDDLRVLLTELMEAFARGRDEMREGLDRHTAAADRRQQDLEADDEATGSDVDEMNDELERADDELDELLQRAEEGLDG